MWTTTVRKILVYVYFGPIVNNRPKNNCSAQLQGHKKNNSNTTVLKHSVVKTTVGFRSILLVPNLHARFKCCSLCLFWHVLPNVHSFSLFCTLFLYTVDSRFLEAQGTLWNTSNFPYFDIPDLRELRITINRTTIFNMNEYVIWRLRDKLKILWKRGEIAPKEQFLLFSTIFCCLLVDLCGKTGARFFTSR